MSAPSTTTHAFVDESPIDGLCDVCGSSVSFHSGSAQHTPTPWRVLDGAVLSQQINRFGNWIVVERPDRENRDEDTANLEFIARSANSHDALVEALKRIIAAYDSSKDAPSARSAMAEIRAVVEPARSVLSDAAR